MTWTRSALAARIADVTSRVRHEGGSPNQAELQIYAHALEDLDPSGAVVVLGMTPELRRLGVERFDRTLAVDHSAEAVELYRDWLPAHLASRETIVCAAWSRLPDLVRSLDRPVQAILGDGVFGNVLGWASQEALLEAIHRVLQPSGRFVTRHASYPVGYDFEVHRAERLLERFRRGELRADEFGFAMRMTGHAALAWDAAEGLLHNRPIFRWSDAARARGELNEQEHGAIERFRFEGDNAIVTQDVWESMLEQAGLGWQKTTLEGRHWYAYYPIYEITP